MIDQYKTKYDPNYYTIGSILNTKYECRLIIISSMNEDDIRKSIIVSLKWALKITETKPILDYYYIINLVNVNKNQINSMNDEAKKLLKEFGNLYTYYYKIKNAIKIKEFFYNSENSELAKTFITLILEDEKEIELKDCFKYIDNIPLRYFIFKTKNSNIIHFSKLKSTDKISFNSAFNYIREYFLGYYHSIVSIMSNDKLSKNSEKNQGSINLKKFFGYFLWAFRNGIKLNNTKIVTYIQVNSIIDINGDYIQSLKSKVEDLEDGESILILQYDQNARMFDVGILEKIAEMFNLYLIQVTTRKNSDEGITITGLNDNANYLNGLFFRN